MVYRNRKTPGGLSTRAQLLLELRGQQGTILSGSVLAQTIGISRVAVWKGIQSLLEAGYPIETAETGYRIESRLDDDFLYPWEFGARETLFRYYEHTDSTMDRARECARQRLEAGTVIIAETQSAGRGRNGRRWVSAQGGLYFTVLEMSALSIADYTLPSLLMQIAAARTLSAICGKPATLRWPNDIYIDQKKIAGVMTEVSGEGDILRQLSIGVGINVNNPALPGKSVSCAGIAGHPVSRREVLLRLLDESEKLKRQFSSTAAYSQGNRPLTAEWNALADGMGAQAAVLDSRSRVLARGMYSGIDPAGRCIITPETGAEALYFNPGPVSVAFFAT